MLQVIEKFSDIITDTQEMRKQITRIEKFAMKIRDCKPEKMQDYEKRLVKCFGDGKRNLTILNDDLGKLLDYACNSEGLSELLGNDKIYPGTTKTWTLDDDVPTDDN
jgi:hypothetical protein